MELIITIESGTLDGQTFKLTVGRLTIGRNSDCDIRFDLNSERIASSTHAFIEAREDGFYIIDNRSTNGTILNGSKIDRVQLTSGDSIQFGKNGIIGRVSIQQETPLANEEFVNSNLIRSTEIKETDKEVYSEIISQPFPVENQSVYRSVSAIGIKGLDKLEAAKKPNTGKYLGIAITVFVIVFLALIVSGIIFLSLGIIPALIAAIVAFIPAFLYLFPLIWLDRYDPEPFWLLSLAFAWGALVAVFVSFIANTVVGLSVAVLTDPMLGNLAGAVLAAPFFEEVTKGAGLLIIVLFFRKYFDGILDGIIFAGVIALGFATVENVLYYGRAFLTGGLSVLVLTFFMRGILSPFAHVTFTAMTGIGFGIARESHNKIVKYTMPFIGLALAMFLHACWNAVAVILGGGFLIFYLIIEIPFFLIFVCFAFWIMWRQNRIIREMLAIDVAQGVIPKEDFERATSAFRSTAWIFVSVFKGKYRVTSCYIRAIGKLGLSYWHIQRATAAQSETMSFQQNPILRKEVIKWRDKV